MATKQTKQTKQTAAPAAAPAAAAAAAAAPAAAPVVALHGGPAVAYVALRPGAVYRVKAEHTKARWERIVQACMDGGGKVAVAELTKECGEGKAQHNYAGPGVPEHFISYCLRRGYLVQA